MITVWVSTHIECDFKLDEFNCSTQRLSKTFKHVGVYGINESWRRGLRKEFIEDEFKKYDNKVICKNCQIVLLKENPNLKKEFKNYDNKCKT